MKVAQKSTRRLRCHAGGRPGTSVRLEFFALLPSGSMTGPHTHGVRFRVSIFCHPEYLIARQGHSKEGRVDDGHSQAESAFIYALQPYPT
jgi:hypothetical protein